MKPFNIETFPLNNHSARVLSTNGRFYFLTRDANEAIGLKGKNTALDNRSIRLDSVVNLVSMYDSNHTSSLKKDTQIIPLGAFLQWVESSKIDSVQNIKEWVARLRTVGGEKEFAREVGLLKNQPLLESATPLESARRMASAAYAENKSLNAGEMLDLPGWRSVAECLEDLGEESQQGVKDEDERERIRESSLIYDHTFRFWVNRMLADIYRSKNGEDPPKRAKGSSSTFVYPLEYGSIIATYRDIYVDTPEIAN